MFLKNKIKNDVNDKENKNDKKIVKPNKTKPSIKWRIFKIILFIILAVIILGFGIIAGVITGVIDKTPDINLDDLKVLKLTTFVYDKDGKVVDSLYDSENRVIVDYKDIPQCLVDAITSIEDERFFQHNGVDVKRTVGAIFSYIIHGGKSSFGGSTITQQLVKNVTSDKQVVWTRKIREWYRALSIEKKMSKEDIFKAYANTIYLGDGSYGVEVASENYFGKSVKDLNIPESAVIAAIIQSPEQYNPYSSDNAKKILLERQKLVLSQMLKLGKITQAQYNDAINYQIVFKQNTTNNKVQSYYVDAVINSVVNDLVSKDNMTKAVALQKIYSGGLKIYTPYDPSVQNAIDSAYNNDKLFYNDSDGQFMQSAMVVMDQYTGNVLGLIGGAGKKTGSMVLSYATDDPRQPGSTMKPLGAYGPAFEQGIAGPDSLVNDSPLTIGNWSPTNYYNWFNGIVTVRQALAKSMNLPAIRTTRKVGIDYAFNFAEGCGLNTLVASGARNDKQLPAMAIGGLTNGVTVLEMANAYSTIANGGIHMTPKLYSKVVDDKGNAILIADTTSNRAMKATTSYLLTQTLKGVVSAGGTAYGYVKLGAMPVAGKTGETDNNTDQWFIGYTPYYTVACWNGYQSRKSIARPYPYISITLFNTVMQAINSGKPVKDFDKPSDYNDSLLMPGRYVESDYNVNNYWNNYNSNNQVKIY